MSSETWRLSTERWPMGDDEAGGRSPMFCLYRTWEDGRWERVGDIWDAEVAELVEADHSDARDAALVEVLRAGIATIEAEIDLKSGKSNVHPATVRNMEADALQALRAALRDQAGAPPAGGDA